MTLGVFPLRSVIRKSMKVSSDRLVNGAFRQCVAMNVFTMSDNYCVKTSLFPEMSALRQRYVFMTNCNSETRL